MEELLHHLIGSLSHYLQGFIHPKWCRISEPSTVRIVDLVFILLLLDNYDNTLGEDQGMSIQDQQPATCVKVFPFHICTVSKTWRFGRSKWLDTWFTPWKINGWNLEITHLEKGRLSEPNLHDNVTAVNLQGCTFHYSNFWGSQKSFHGIT